MNTEWPMLQRCRQMHLNQSSRNSHSYLVSYKNSKKNRNGITEYGFDSFVPFSISGLMENGSINLPNDPYYDKVVGKVVGSCNGLVCLLGYSLSKNKAWLRFWNPATRTISDKSGYFHYDHYFHYFKLKRMKFTFGYDNSTDTYKVVALHSAHNRTTVVKVLSFGDNIWRKIQSFNARLLLFLFSSHGGDVHLNCTVNWSACIKNGDFAYKFVIISLDLGTETHTQLLPPPVSLSLMVNILLQGVCVLMDSLCYYHDFEGTNFVIWRMTKFGDEKSWTQFLKFCYKNLHINYDFGFNLIEYDDTLIFTHYDQTILYNLRNKRVVKTNVDKNIYWSSINKYVESLVSTG